MVKGKKAFIFTFAAMIIILFVVTYFGFKSESNIDAELDNDNFRVDKMNGFLRDLFELYLPVAIEGSTVEAFDAMNGLVSHTKENITDFECEFSHAFTYGNYDLSIYTNMTNDQSLGFDIMNSTDIEKYGDDENDYLLEDTTEAALQPFVYDDEDEFLNLVSITLYGRVLDKNATVRVEIRDTRCGHLSGGYLFAFERFYNKSDDLKDYPIPLVDARAESLEKGKQYYLLVRFFQDKAGEEPQLRLKVGPNNFVAKIANTTTYRSVVPNEDALGMIGRMSYMFKYMRENMKARVVGYNLTNLSAEVRHVNPFKVKVNTSMTFSVEIGDTSWEIVNETVEKVVDIELMRDPLFRDEERYIQEFDFRSLGVAWFNNSDHSIFNEFLQLKGDGKIASYINSTGRGPSFLERFQNIGVNLDTYGITSVVSSYSSYYNGLHDGDYSDVDYLLIAKKEGLELYNETNIYDPVMVIDIKSCKLLNLTCECANPPFGNNITAC